MLSFRFFHFHALPKVASASIWELKDVEDARRGLHINVLGFVCCPSGLHGNVVIWGPCPLKEQARDKEGGIGLSLNPGHYSAFLPVAPVHQSE